MKATANQNEADARAHKITWMEASRRDTAKACEVGGSRLTSDGGLSFSLHAALAAEVDAGRMTPEMATLKYEHSTRRSAAPMRKRARPSSSGGSARR